MVPVTHPFSSYFLQTQTHMYSEALNRHSPFSICRQRAHRVFQSVSDRFFLFCATLRIEKIFVMHDVCEQLSNFQAVYIPLLLSKPFTPHSARATHPNIFQLCRWRGGVEKLSTVRFANERMHRKYVVIWSSSFSSSVMLFDYFIVIVVYFGISYPNSRS